MEGKDLNIRRATHGLLFQCLEVHAPEMHGDEIQ